MLSPQQLVTYINEHMDEWAGVPGKRQVSPILFCGELSESNRTSDIRANARKKPFY